MEKNVPENFSGMLDLRNSGFFEAHFRVEGFLVTIIPFTEECLGYIKMLDVYESDEYKHSKTITWVFGVDERGRSVAFSKKNRVCKSIVSPITLNAATFVTGVIVTTKSPVLADISSFDSIEFAGETIDLLYPPTSALVYNRENAAISFKNKKDYTKTYKLEINEEHMNIDFSINTRYSWNISKAPDLREEIKSFIKLSFDGAKPLEAIAAYYGYIMSLCEFCIRQRNLSLEITLNKKYEHKVNNGKSEILNEKIFVKFFDGHDDYAHEKIEYCMDLNFRNLGDRLPYLFKLLSEKNTKPNLLYLPYRNIDSNSINHTMITDLCASIEREYGFIFGNPSNNSDANCSQFGAKMLHRELKAIVKNFKHKNKIDNITREKALNLIGKLKNSEPSFKEKSGKLYNLFKDYIKPIAEDIIQIPYDFNDPSKVKKYRQGTVYDEKEFKKIVGIFYATRSRASHGLIVWDESSMSVYKYLELIVYFCILYRAGYELDECQNLLKPIFRKYFYNPEKEELIDEC